MESLGGLAPPKRNKPSNQSQKSVWGISAGAARRRNPNTKVKCQIHIRESRPDFLRFSYVHTYEEREGDVMVEEIENNAWGKEERKGRGTRTDVPKRKEAGKKKQMREQKKG